jgi:hypothetical protein
VCTSNFHDFDDRCGTAGLGELVTTARVSRSITPNAWGSNNANKLQNSILAQVAEQDINSALQGKGLQMVCKGKRPRDPNQLAKWIVDQSTKPN